MKYILFLLFFGCAGAFGQGMGKRVIDSSAVNNWKSLRGTPLVSGNGEYIAYEVCYHPFGEGSYVVQSMGGGWKKELGVGAGGIFSVDSKRFMYQRGDTLYQLLLGSDSVRRVTGVSSYKYVGVGTGGWLVWRLRGVSGELIAGDLSTGREMHFPGVDEYLFTEGGHGLVMETQGEEGALTLRWVELPTGESRVIWSGHGKEKAGGYNVDGSGKQLVFVVEQGQGEEGRKSLWYYQAGMGSAVEKVNNGSAGISEGLKVAGGYTYFSSNGRYIFFGLQGPALPKAGTESEQVDVWSYRDTVLQPVQVHRLGPAGYRAAIGVEKGDKVIRLEREYDQVVAEGGDAVVVSHDERGDKFWLHTGYGYDLVSLRDGSRKGLLENRRCDNFWFSPGGRWLVYYRDEGYSSYDLKEGVERRISGGVPAGKLSWFSDRYGAGDPDIILPIGIGGWEQGDGGLLVYDEYDLWRLDPSGRWAAVNMTREYGRLHHIKLRVSEEEQSINKGVGAGSELLLTGFNTDSKYNGFYRMKVGEAREPELLTMGPWTLDHQGGGFFFPLNAQEYDEGMRPVKAGTAGWVVRRSTATEAPNYYITGDFRSFRAVTDIHPQTGYKWLSTELVNYRELDGEMSQGVLYKPEDFEAGKKYPVIIQYYEQLSHRLYEYPVPYFSDGDINIAWFVSHGYLVFTPDIHYQVGRPGESAVNAVEGAGRYLSELPYVDEGRMGVVGHSWGGFETYYLVTHSHLFAAALAAAGGSGSGDWISESLSLGNYGEAGSLLNDREGEMGATLWERPDLYLENSPVLRADRLSTPLLMFHCKADENWEQAVEMFVALRRLGKRAWLLQYDHGSHTVWGRDMEDYTRRVEQFFDHYLKGERAPRWLTEGIPAKLKGIERRYELDSSGREP